jgi:hypothetical protein
MEYVSNYVSKCVDIHGLKCCESTAVTTTDQSSMTEPEGPLPTFHEKRTLQVYERT